MKIAQGTLHKWRAVIKGVAMLHIFALSVLVIFFARVPSSNTLNIQKNHGKNIISKIFSPRVAHASEFNIYTNTLANDGFYITTIDFSNNFDYYSNGGLAQDVASHTATLGGVNNPYIVAQNIAAQNAAAG